MKLQTLQMYRGIIVLMIAISHAIEVLNHTGFAGLNFLKTRTGGVDFFFTLSGFLIFYVYSNNSPQNSILRRFLIRRFLKIYPLVWLFTTLSLPFYFFGIVSGSGFETHLSVIFNSLLLLPQSADPVLGATWSLTHVILFYTVFYFYLKHPRFTTLGLKVWITLIVFNLLFGHVELKNSIPHIWKNFLLNPINLEFLFGAMLAKIAIKKEFCHGVSAIALGCVTFFCGWYFLQKDSNPLYISATFCFASLLLIYGGVALDRKYSIELPLAAKTLGDSSYAIMIVNLPIIVTFSKLFGDFFLKLNPTIWISYIAVILAVVLSVIGGVLTNKSIEPPLLKLGTLFSKKKSNSRMDNVKN